MFWPTFAELLPVWLDDPSYSHGPIILPGAIALAIWARWSDVIPRQGNLTLGLLYLLVGSLVHFGALIFGWLLLDFAAMAFVLRGLAVVVGGRDWAWRLSFPILLLFFMFPLPEGWTARIAVWLQDIVSRASAGVFELFFVCMRKGNSLHIAGVSEPLFVAEECSGLRQIVAFVAMGAVAGELIEAKRWARIFLLAVAIPVAILANVIRVLLMGFGAYHFGTDWISSDLHGAPAMISLPLGILLYGLICLSFAKKSPATPAATPPAGGDATGEPEKVAEPEVPPAPPLRVGRPLMVSCVLLAAGLAGQRALLDHLSVVKDREMPTIRQQLATLPAEFGGSDAQALKWISREHPGREVLATQVEDFADEFLYRAYWPVKGRQAGKPASVYVVFSSEAGDRKHHPEVCVRDVSGAKEDTAAGKVIALGGDESRTVQRFRFLPSADRAIVIYYWHYTLAPAPVERPSAFQKLHERYATTPPSVTVQVSTPASLEEAELLEKTLLVELDAALREGHLPADVRMGCDRIPIQVLGR